MRLQVIYASAAHTSFKLPSSPAKSCFQYRARSQQRISSAANIRTPSANDSGRSSTAADDDKFNQLVERIKDDQGMQQALFAYLPEGMRNKESVIRMVGSPEYRTMLESMMQASPAMREIMDNLDWEAPELATDLSLEEKTERIMNDPELLQTFTNPDVLDALKDVKENPTNIEKYLGDPEVMGVYAKMSARSSKNTQ